MRSMLAILVVAWACVVGPALCLAGIGSHLCACEDDPSSALEAKPCECDSHNPNSPEAPRHCPHDPCKADVCRIEQDALAALECAADFAPQVGMDLSSMVWGEPTIEPGTLGLPLYDTSPPACSNEAFAENNQPLLI